VHNAQQQPDAFAVAASIHNLCGPQIEIFQITQVDNKGGFLIVLGGEQATAVQNAGAVFMALQGKATLQGEPAAEDIVPISERLCGALIGHRGENLRRIKCESGAHIEVTPWCGSTATRLIQLRGSPNACAMARQLINQSLAEMQQATTVGPASSPPQAISPPMPAMDGYSMMQGGMTMHPPAQAMLEQQVSLPRPRPPAQVQSTSPPPGLQRTYSDEFPRINSQQPAAEAPMMGLNNSPQQAMMAQSQALIAQSEALARAAEIALANPAPQAMSPVALAASPSTGKFQIQRTTSVETLLRDPKVHEFRLKSHWCLLKDRVSVLTELRTAVKNYADAKSWSVVEQEKRDEEQGIKFGARSKSWAHFLRAGATGEGATDEGDIWGAPAEEQLPARVTSKLSNKFKLQRTCSTGSLQPSSMLLRQCLV